MPLYRGKLRGGMIGSWGPISNETGPPSLQQIILVEKELTLAKANACQILDSIWAMIFFRLYSSMTTKT